jgi:hypothetical protein
MEPIDLVNDEDWNKAMYHNYITLIKKEEDDTKIPINYISLYCPEWKDDAWHFDQYF